MVRDVVTVSPDATARDAIVTLLDNRISGAPVIDDDGVLVGVISEFALLAVFYDGTLSETRVSELMSPDPISVSESSSLEHAANLLIDQRIRRLPVVNQNRVVGIIGRRDLLRSAINDGCDKIQHDAFNNLLETEAIRTAVSGILNAVARSISVSTARDEPPEDAKITVGDIMQSDVVCIGIDDTLGRAREICDHHRIHHLIVRNGEKVVGLVSYSDIRMNLSPFVGRKWSERKQDQETVEQKVHQIMTRQLISTTEAMYITDAAQLMLRNAIACLPVLNKDGELRGIVTLKDLVRSVCRIERTRDVAAQ